MQLLTLPPIAHHANVCTWHCWKFIKRKMKTPLWKRLQTQMGASIRPSESLMVRSSAASIDHTRFHVLKQLQSDLDKGINHCIDALQDCLHLPFWWICCRGILCFITHRERKHQNMLSFEHRPRVLRPPVHCLQCGAKYDLAHNRLPLFNGHCRSPICQSDKRT